MMRMHSLLASIVAAAMLGGCLSYTYELKRQSGTDLSTVDTTVVGYSNAPFINTTEVRTTLYALSDVRYSVAAPGAAFVSSSTSTAVVANVRGQMFAIEFGSGLTLTNVRNGYDFGSYASQVANASANGSNKTVYDQIASALGTVRDAGSDSIVGWGRWAGTVKINGTDSACCDTSFKNLHYVFGVASPTIPSSGTATFSMIGATSPTLSDGSAVGTLTSGQLAVQWGGTTKIAVSATGTVGGNAFLLQTPGGLAGVASSPIIYNFATRTFSGSWLALIGAPNATVNGFFAGTNASHAALTYSTPASPTVMIQGAAAFKQ